MLSTEETLLRVKEKISNGYGGAYLRFGDGDIVVATGGSDKLQSASSDLASILREALCADTEAFEFGLPFHLQKWGTAEKGMSYGEFCSPKGRTYSLLRSVFEIRSQAPLKTVVSSSALSYASIHNPSLAISVLKTVKHHAKLVIANENLMHPLKDQIFGSAHFVRVPSKNPFGEFDRILEDSVRRLNDMQSTGVVVIAAGVTGRAIVWRLQSLYPESYFFDFGSLLDSIMGAHSRTWSKRRNVEIEAFVRSLLDENHLSN